jgi:hypothetical protein
MARTGVMSDVAIKHHCPEMFPPDLASHKAMHPSHLQAHIFTGIKSPRETQTFSDFARFPLTDLQNFAMVAAPSRTPHAFMESVYAYRKQLGSTNVPSDILAGYDEQMTSSFSPRGMKTPASTVIGSSTFSEASTDVADIASLTHAPASLTLGKTTRREGLKMFDKEFAVAKSFMEPHTRAMVSNIARGESMDGVLNILFPDGFSPRGGKLSHGEALSRLNQEYRTDKEALAVIARADAAAKKQDISPYQGTGLMSYIIGTREAQMEAADEP